MEDEDPVILSPHYYAADLQVVALFQDRGSDSERSLHILDFHDDGEYLSDEHHNIIRSLRPDTMLS